MSYEWATRVPTVTRRKSVTEVRVNDLAEIGGWLGFGTASGQSVSPLTATDVTAVFCAARVIAEGIGQMPVRVVEYIPRPDGLPRLKVRTDHWAHKLLSIKPNEWQTGYEFREGMVFNAALAGGSIAIKNIVRGEVREVLPVPPGAWSVEQLSDWNLRIRVDYADKSHGYFELADVFYLRGPAMDGFKAIPAIRAAREAIGLSRVLERQQARLAGNGGKPSGVLSSKMNLTPEARENLRKTWQARYGADGEGGIAVLDGEASFQSMTMTNVDSQYIETRRMQIEEIARAFRVQPIMLMQADKAATFASAEQMFRNHVIHTLGPWMVRWEETCARDVLSHEAGLGVDLDERNLLRGDFKDQAEYYAKALGSGGAPGWMTQNEVRVDVGLNPLDDAEADKLSAGAMNPQGDDDGTD